MRELSILAKYPFLQDARQYIKDNGPSVGELLHDLPYERARLIGIDRLENAMKNRDVGERSLATDSDCIMEILSYPLARMVAVCIGDNFFRKRYALSEAFHAYTHLVNEPTPFLLSVAKELHVNVQQPPDEPTIKIFLPISARAASVFCDVVDLPIPPLP